MNNPFIIFALPRSRTYWLSRYLSHDHWTCHHDLVVTHHSISALFEVLSQPLTGTVETGAMLGWQVFLRAFPSARIVVVYRSLDAIATSLARNGLLVDRSELEFRHGLLDEITRLPQTLVVNFDELRQPEAGREVYEYCLERPFDRQWWVEMSRRNLQIDMNRRIVQLIDNAAGMAALRREVLGEMRGLV